MNRICTLDNVKKLTVTKVWEYLVAKGLTEEYNQGGVFIKTQTKRGFAIGIKMVDKLNQVGNSYKFLMYPENAQKMILEYFISARQEIEEQNDVELKEIEIKPSKKKVGSKRKYADWIAEYPDTVVVKKEGAFFTVRGDSARVVGDITEFNVSNGSNPITGSPIKEGITEALIDNQINYIVVFDDEIVEQETYELNHYFEYI